MVDSWYCLDRVVPEGMSQVSRRLEVGNHIRRTFHTSTSSGTSFLSSFLKTQPNHWTKRMASAGTFAVSAGPYIIYHADAGTKNEPYKIFVPVQKKGWKINPHVSNLRSR